MKSKPHTNRLTEEEMTPERKPKSEVFQGDCRDFLKDVPDKYFDTIITDPPYGVGLEYSSYNDTEENWYLLMSKFIPLAKRCGKMVIMPSCRIKALPWIYQNFPPDWLISWYKGSPGHSAFIGFNDWEPILVYGKTEGCQMHDYMAMTNGVSMGSFGHPCPKPVNWFRWLMKRSMKNGGHTCDPFMGSQSSRIASHEMGFDYTGYELDADYFTAGSKRFEQFKSQLNMF